jgi:hypothetical protein
LLPWQNKAIGSRKFLGIKFAVASADICVFAGTGNLDILFAVFDASASALISHAPEHTFNHTTGWCCVFQFGGFNLHPRMFCAVFRAQSLIF